MLKSRLTFSNVVSFLALFVALGGVSYAAITIPNNSVGSAQIKDGQVMAADISAGTRNTLMGSKGPKGEPGTSAQKVLSVTAVVDVSPTANCGSSYQPTHIVSSSVAAGSFATATVSTTEVTDACDSGVVSRALVISTNAPNTVKCIPWNPSQSNLNRTYTPAGTSGPPEDPSSYWPPEDSYPTDWPSTAWLAPDRVTETNGKLAFEIKPWNKNQSLYHDDAVVSRQTLRVVLECF